VDRNKTLELTPKPQELPEGSVDQRSWHQYQAYLSRIRPVARAEFYQRLMESRGLKSIRALAKLIGEDWSRRARISAESGYPRNRRNFHRAAA